MGRVTLHTLRAYAGSFTTQTIQQLPEKHQRGFRATHLLCLVWKSLAISRVRDGHRNRKNRCDFGALSPFPIAPEFRALRVKKPNISTGYHKEIGILSFQHSYAVKCTNNLYVSLRANSASVANPLTPYKWRIQHFLVVPCREMLGFVWLKAPFSGAIGNGSLPRNLDGPPIRNANRGDSRELIRATRFADKKPYFHNVWGDSRESPQTCDSHLFSPPKRDSQKRGVQFGNPETIRKNRAIRANLRIDSRESGHLSPETLFGPSWGFWPL